MEIAKTCRENNAVSVWVYLPTTEDILDPSEFGKLEKLAIQCNFIPIDLRGVYGKGARENIQISKKDTHPNSRGQLMISNKFYNELIKNKKELIKSR